MMQYFSPLQLQQFLKCTIPKAQKMLLLFFFHPMENNGTDLEKGKLHDIREEGKKGIFMIKILLWGCLQLTSKEI